jgi:hypothetical protein
MTFGHVLGTVRHRASPFDYHRAPRFKSDQGKCCGAGDENRTRMTSLEGRGHGACLCDFRERSVLVRHRE